jgi:hypothetical protein
MRADEKFRRTPATARPGFLRGHYRRRVFLILGFAAAVAAFITAVLVVVVWDKTRPTTRRASSRDACSREAATEGRHNA